ncbi:type II secretory ATPase GspE/PulE/Tfp pilus assembly ATPase PilB-like protein [Tepidamorphus gemmatus]|uniref:Type II secretory ATPase GspE/PulE/Tfp pilus assembly ATPase PilB-like protein n=1 Tax=Tepidamorphus gemmatus TaxID=747076 RepID=A0A4R3MEJ2_9HYPH|nr:ATPase, T2SS/T4P/T4SS family [Tepidamorphus gemmatus]TCT10729.1 type II secretory ATPase GspE/PulE/Tfp pilus assembly ATPase PilB-like protein [Tepidamorphus gemmatus]
MSSSGPDRFGGPATPGRPAVALITRLADVPGGIPVDDMVPEEWRDRFVALIDEVAASVHVLTVPEAMGSHAMFDLRRRLGERGIANPIFVRTSAEIVKVVREHRRAAGSSSLAGADATGIERFARELIDEALLSRASDIHVETRSTHAEVFFRVDGLRRRHSNISMESARGLGVVLYSVHADASSKDVAWDPQQVMDGVIEHQGLGGETVQLRFSSAPIFPTGNFHIVIRLLRMDVSQLTLDQLGYTQDQRALLETFIASLSGMVLLCGPTNSGKSTTLQALMRRLHAHHGEALKMITVEDPVEYLVPGACQISLSRRRRNQIDERTGSVFTTYLRGALRQDPDVVMIGEIRDHDSAVVAKDFVLTGRKLFATLHTYSAVWAFVRLRELGLPSELLAMPGFISGIVYQRLVPTVCNGCAAPLRTADALPRALYARLEGLGADRLAGIRLRGPGCLACGGSGIGGRTLCAEFVATDPELLDLIGKDRHHDAERHWLARGGVAVGHFGVTALAHGADKMCRGEVDPRDLESSVGLLSMLSGRDRRGAP